jgi:hypothetical protein
MSISWMRIRWKFNFLKRWALNDGVLQTVLLKLLIRDENIKEIEFSYRVLKKYDIDYKPLIIIVHNAKFFIYATYFTLFVRHYPQDEEYLPHRYKYTAKITNHSVTFMNMVFIHLHRSLTYNPGINITEIHYVIFSMMR